MMFVMSLNLLFSCNFDLLASLRVNKYICFVANHIKNDLHDVR